MWMRARDQAALRLKAEHSLTIVRIEKDLGSAAIDARRGEYEAARQEASAFTPRRDSRPTSAGSRRSASNNAMLLHRCSPHKMSLTTLLARSDPASADRTVTLYVTVRKVLGV